MNNNLPETQLCTEHNKMGYLKEWGKYSHPIGKDPQTGKTTYCNKEPQAVNPTEPIRETVKNPDWDAIAEGKVRHGVAVAFIQALGPRLIEEGVPIISDTIRLEMSNWVKWIMEGK